MISTASIIAAVTAEHKSLGRQRFRFERHTLYQFARWLILASLAMAAVLLAVALNS